MGDDAIIEGPRKSGFFKSGCGCLTLLALAVALSGAVLYLLLADWDPDRRAWERLPPETAWAVEIHDAKSLLQASLGDQNAVAFLRRILAAVDKSDIGGSGREALLVEIANGYDNLGRFHTVLAPNALWVGGFDLSLDSTFVIFSPPTWMRWMAALSGYGENQIIDFQNNAGKTMYFTLRDAYCIAGQSHEAIRGVLDGWEIRGMPLGPAPDVSGPHIYAAYHATPKDDPDGNPTPETAGASHFTLVDPFAVSRPETVSAREPAALRNAAVLIYPEGKGRWNGWCAVNAGDGETRRIDETSVATLPTSASMPDGGSLAVSVRMSAETKTALLEHLRAAVPPIPTGRTNGTMEDAAVDWLYRSWLENTGDAWTLVAGKPAAPANKAPFPPMPAVGLGWDISGAISPENAANMFTRPLVALLESATAPGGPLPAQVLKANVSHSLDEGGDAPGGVVSLPPVLVNSARPCWRFLLRSNPPTGWIASDPAAIPDPARIASLPSAGLPAPRASCAVAGGRWNMDAAFLDAVIDLLRDRSGVFRDGDSGRLADLFRAFFIAFPNGAFSLEHDMRDGRLLFRTSISGK